MKSQILISLFSILASSADAADVYAWPPASVEHLGIMQDGQGKWVNKMMIVLPEGQAQTLKPGEGVYYYENGRRELFWASLLGTGSSNQGETFLQFDTPVKVKIEPGQKPGKLPRTPSLEQLGQPSELSKNETLLPADSGKSSGSLGKAGELLSGSLGRAGQSALQTGISSLLFDRLVLTGRDRAEFSRLENQVKTQLAHLKNREIRLQKCLENIEEIFQKAGQVSDTTAQETLDQFLKKNDFHAIQTADPEVRDRIRRLRFTALHIEPGSSSEWRAKEFALGATSLADSFSHSGKENEISDWLLVLAGDAADLALGLYPPTSLAKSAIEYSTGRSFIDGHSLQPYEQALALFDLMTAGISGPATTSVQRSLSLFRNIRHLGTAGKVADDVASIETPVKWVPPYEQVIVDNLSSPRPPALTSTMALRHHLFQFTPLHAFDDSSLYQTVERYYGPTKDGLNMNGSAAALLRRDILAGKIRPGSESASPSYARALAARSEVQNLLMRSMSNRDRAQLNYLLEDLNHALTSPYPLMDIPEPPGRKLLPGSFQ